MASINNSANYQPTQYAVQVGGANNALSSLTVGTNGQLFIGSTGANPAFATATSTAGSITYTTGAGSLNLDVTNYATTTFTPTLTGASTAGTTTYSTQVGNYTYFLNLCYVYGSIIITAATGTGDVVIGGLPKTINSSAGNVVGGLTLSGTSFTLPASCTDALTYGLSNTTTAKIQCFGSGQSTSFLQMANGALTLVFQLLYQV
jgi:hypothetical protein